MDVHSITSNLPKDAGCSLRVERTNDPYKGRLIISDRGKDVVDEIVPLSYGAKFGPDIQDTIDWERRFERYLDKERS